jgi:hypothetical protein
MPPEFGGAEIHVRLDNTADDLTRHLNRTENLRAFPAGSAVYDSLDGQRQDAESNNRGFDDTLYLRRAHSVGAQRRLLNMIGRHRLPPPE